MTGVFLKNVDSWAFESKGKWCDSGDAIRTLNCFEVGCNRLHCIGRSDFRPKGKTFISLSLIELARQAG